jgi:hypothetical protein
MNEHFANLVFFLLWAERQDAKQMYGGIRIDQAIDSLAAIIGRDPQQLRELVQ